MVTQWPGGDCLLGILEARGRGPSPLSEFREELADPSPSPPARSRRDASLEEAMFQLSKLSLEFPLLPSPGHLERLS